MAYKQESHDSYVDGLKVKISERYKPPPRISPVVTYAQRLILNKQTQDNIAAYDFSLDEAVLARTKQWKAAKAALIAERQSRLEHERSKQEPEEEEEVEDVVVNNNSFCNDTILMPTRVADTILTPIPINQQFINKKDDKSPFNISDFENDTSSPFDNMELKSINDMEELAQVLNKGEKVSYPYQSQLNYGNYQYSSYIPNSTSYVAPTSNSNYSYTNGYYYNNPNQSFTYVSPYSFPDLQETKSTTKSVPDIVNALETELENVNIRKEASTAAPRPKSTEAVCSLPKNKTQTTDLNWMTKSDQDLCKMISSMGFPLERVARVCKLIGNDQKKIVDHLLALSDLLDLGFPETKVSDALMQCDNDRDKALDKLIL